MSKLIETQYQASEILPPCNFLPGFVGVPTKFFATKSRFWPFYCIQFGRIKMNIQRFEVHLAADLPEFRNEVCVATLLIPEFLLWATQEHEIGKFGLAITLRILLFEFRQELLARDLPINQYSSRTYQSPGLNLIKRNFRPEISIWEEFGFFADFIGVSRCHLFSLLLWMKLNKSRDVGGPTSRLEQFDLHNPRYLEIRKRIYPTRWARIKNVRRRREILQKSHSPEKVPHIHIPYPQNIEWIRYVLRGS